MSLSDLRVSSPAQLVAVVPYLLGFHPRDSLVVVGRRDRALVFAARQDLPPPETPLAELDEFARQTAAVVARQTVDSVVLLGYTERGSGAALVAAVGDALLDLAIPVREQLRVADGRFWCYLCTDEGCCPPAGRSYDAEAGQVREAAGFQVFADRAALVASVAPVQGDAREAMRAATAEADRRLDELAAGQRTGPGALLGAIHRAGVRAVGTALTRYRGGGILSDAEVAWLTVLLAHAPVGEYALNRADAAGWQVTLWSDVLRRASAELSAMPAVLLAFTAWRTGQGALAAVAVDRALDADPSLGIARLLDEVLTDGIPPSALDRPGAA
ncbi:DUF4192 domain-containing protein [Catenuloplanes atrovinosus]|uniref:DUF4192 domain-containing protein n=1 Tax=Catenuloplanes atrovinosus TaxID=137266 RepID=A0AAE4CCU4_9ACTN|nr:DUF4192 domain-containing protein [Catenuloplanes atrovinosus]MDR7279986.1 hypothetical protein [Catenuloplanes atrovinosus]